MCSTREKTCLNPILFDVSTKGKLSKTQHDQTGGDESNKMTVSGREIYTYLVLRTAVGFGTTIGDNIALRVSKVS